MQAWILAAAGMALGLGQAVVGYLVNKSNRQQEAQLNEIKAEIKALGEFKDSVLARYPTRAEIGDIKSDCKDKFSNIFDRLRELERS
ncbi:hypothetical protein AAU61_14470 [Desulfocarbo indianensis]|nr:hypothetical protein AAU61_14470 [Desulfocarbo indianensis]